MKPIDPLITEHSLIARMLEVVRKEMRLAGEKNQIDATFIDATVDFIRWYADRTHHAKEEAILFRDVARKDMSPAHKDLLRELIEDHDFGRKTVGRLVEAKGKYLQGSREALKSILHECETLIDFYYAHIRKEEQVFFPASMEYLTEQEQEAMLREFWESDRKMIHAKYGAVVDQYEKTAQ